MRLMLKLQKELKKTCQDERPEANYASKFHTPNIKTIDSLAQFFKINAFYTIKAVVKKSYL